MLFHISADVVYLAVAVAVALVNLVVVVVVAIVVSSAVVYLLNLVIDLIVVVIAAAAVVIVNLADSVERHLEDFVKTWEAEVTHKPDLSQWMTTSKAGTTTSVNGREPVTGVEANRQGNYKTLLGHCPLYNKLGLMNHL